jgi:hypothetical protein
MKLYGKKLESRLRTARTMLDNKSKKSFGKGEMDLKNERFLSSKGTWALQYRYHRDGRHGSDGAVFIAVVR